ncbi:protein kintoun isoform X2 [Sceloporus undulatus]|uniref:protein kintoun isoform X2 n=1 Tax=Sceloporus undulatus TaxID=8520 RepID=UPI001C4B706F|nr:protein kintoun isoform X2 [Sceloporus undulatus]
MAAAPPPSSGREELELTGEEAERLARAFQDEGFRQLFAEYAAELADPSQRALYEAEVAALERERGVEARFLHPTPGWVLRTSQEGSRRCYLNLCSHAAVGRPQARPAPGGSAWRLPHCLGPGREELGRRRRGPGQGPPRRHWVYDVLFHPEALRLAARSPRFRRLLEATALEAVEKHFAPGLDRANAATLRGVKYKGVPQASLLRSPLPGGPPSEPGPPSPLPPFPSPYAYPPPAPELQAQPSPPSPPPDAARPRWSLLQRSFVDLQDYRHSRDSAPSPIPRELEVSVELPLLRSAAAAQLEVVGRELRLDSPPPAAYRLRLPLPYAVDEARAKAAFDKAKRRLVVTLPVLRSQASPRQEQEEGEGGEGEAAASSGAQGPPPPGPHAAQASSSPAAKGPHLPAKPGPDPAAGFAPKRSPPETATPIILDLPVRQEEAGSLALLPSSSAGSLPEQPGSPAGSSIPPEGQPRPSKADGDHHHYQSHHVAPLLSPPAAHLSSSAISQPPGSPRASSDHPSLSQGMELSTDAHSPMPPALAPQSGASASEPPLPSSPGLDLPPVPTCDKDMDPVVPDMAAAEFTQKRSPPATATSTIPDLPVGQEKEEEALPLPLPPSLSAGKTLEQPGTSARSSSPPEGHPHPSKTDRDHHQSRNMAPLLSPPGAHLSSKPSESPMASGDCSSLSQSTELSTNACSPVPPLCSLSQVDVVAPALCPRSGTCASTSPLPSSAGPDAPPTPFPGPDSSGSPASPALLLCPPFHCTQDEKGLTLLLQVPGVVPQSLKEEVDTNQYRVSFHNKDSASFTILLRFLPENKLAPPESKVSVSPNNVIVILAKSPEAIGLWTKLYFGPNVDTLQERWFVTESNVDKFLSSLPSTSCSGQFDMKEQPLIEVLDISEGKSQIRLKAQKPDKTEPGRGNGKQSNGSKLSTDAEDCLVQSERVLGSLTAVETMGQVGKGPSHCLALDLHDPSSAIPQKSQRHDFHESELASSTSNRATSTTSAQLSLEQPAQTGEEGEICSKATENKQGREGSPAAPVIMETNMQDGSVQYISDHTTHCALTFQNAFLYELD